MIIFCKRCEFFVFRYWCVNCDYVICCLYKNNLCVFRIFEMDFRDRLFLNEVYIYDDDVFGNLM